MENRSETIREATEASKARYEWLVKKDKRDIIGFIVLIGVIIALYLV